MIALQPVEWRLRGAEGDFRHGEPYSVSATVTRVTGNLAVITCMTGKLYAAIRQEIGEELSAMGFARAIWEDGGGTIYEQDLKRFG